MATVVVWPKMVRTRISATPPCDDFGSTSSSGSTSSLTPCGRARCQFSFMGTVKLRAARTMLYCQYSEWRGGEGARGRRPGKGEEGQGSGEGAGAGTGAAAGAKERVEGEGGGLEARGGVAQMTAMPLT